LKKIKWRAHHGPLLGKDDGRAITSCLPRGGSGGPFTPQAETRMPKAKKNKRAEKGFLF
jgi:hypothetical protein